MKPFAVLDVETTGFNPYRNDRVVEIGVVLWVPGQGIVGEFSTLVNPERDVGPTKIHGITASDVIHAPKFSEIAGQLADFLKQAVILAGHNLRFDLSFLTAEFERIGIEMPEYSTLDSMILAGGGTLSACCADYEIEQSNFHEALNDARSTTLLIEKLLSIDDPDLAQINTFDCPDWPQIPHSQRPLAPRAKGDISCQPAPSYLKRLSEKLSGESNDILKPEGERDYRALLWRALEDGQIEESESDALVEVATNWKIPLSRIEAIHFDYLSELARAAWADHFLSDSERKEILQAAHLLGFGTLSEEKLQDLLHSSENKVEDGKKPSNASLLAGKSVCFTGECCCSIGGEAISRSLAEIIAADKGLKVASSVTKKLDILVVADPNTQSGKAKLARKYGTRIISERVFWRTLEISVD